MTTSLIFLFKIRNASFSYLIAFLKWLKRRQHIPTFIKSLRLSNMKIHEAADFFRDLLIKTDGTSERKIYQTFLGILTDLNMRGLTSSQLYEIENKLDELQLIAANNNQKKYLKKKLAIFEEYLEKDFSLVKEEHYQNTGISMGMIFGMLAGMIFGPSFGISNGMIMGMLGGMVIGLIIGQNKDKEAKLENRVMSIKVK